MRKPQRQPKLASLSEAELEQLADLLRHQTYDAVLARVTKPRPEGFDLNISLSPLRTFHAKVGLLDAINAKLPADRKISLALFETFETREIYYLTSAENEKTLAEAHQKILNATIDLTDSADNTPTQLSTLQRLIDFPARAEIRANKEARAEEMHDHRIEMNHFRKHIATERLALAQKSFNLRQSLVAADVRRLTSTSRDEINESTATPADKEPSSSPFPTRDDGQGEGFTAQSNDARPADQKSRNEPEKENFPSSPNSKLTTKNSKLGPGAFTHSPEFLAKSRQHTHDLITGKIKPKFIPPEIPCPDPDPLWDWLIDDYVAPPGVNTDPNRYVNGEAQPHLDSRTEQSVEKTDAVSPLKSHHNSRSERPFSGNTFVAGSGSQISNLQSTPNNPNTQPSADTTSSPDVPNTSNGGTRSPSPTSTSRDEIYETTAAPADPIPPFLPSPSRGEGQGEGFRAQSNDACPVDPQPPLKSQISNLQSIANNPNARPSADTTSSTDARNPFTGGTTSGSPASTSRDEMNETTAAPADLNASNSAAPNSESPENPLSPQLSTTATPHPFPPHTLPSHEAAYFKGIAAQAAAALNEFNVRRKNHETEAATTNH